MPSRCPRVSALACPAMRVLLPKHGIFGWTFLSTLTPGQDKRDADGPDRHIKAQSKQDRDMRDPKGPDAEDVEAESDSSAARCWPCLAASGQSSAVSEAQVSSEDTRVMEGLFLRAERAWSSSI